MGWASDYWTQVKSLLRRISIIKARIKKHAITEFLWPIMFIVILALIRYMANVSTVNSKRIERFPNETLSSDKQFSGVILVIPSSAKIFVQQAVKNFSTVSSLNTKGFDNLSDAERYYRSRNGSGVYAGVIFHQLYNNYTIRTKFTESASPLAHLNSNEDCRPDSPSCPSKLYISNGFLVLQWAINSALLTLNQSKIRIPELSLQQLPKSSFIPDSTFIRQFAPVYYAYIYSFFVQFLVLGLVAEKQTRQKEMLRIMGMKDSAFWLSWSLLYLFIITIVSAIAVAFAALTAFFSVNSNMFIFFLILTLYGCTIINLAFVLSTFLNNPNVAGPVSVLATTAISSMFVIVSLTTEYDANGTPSSVVPVFVQWLLCLLSPTALAIAVERAIYLDVSQIGITWSSLHLGDFPLFAPLVMLAVDAVLYLILAVWLDNVVPGQYGKTQPLCYCFTPSYWYGKRRRRRNSAVAHHDDTDQENECPHIEPVPIEVKNLNHLRILNIKKTYRVGGKPLEAVKGITLDIYENMITCVLGHNGAGKTSLMNMLTGLTTPTSGTAHIYGHDIRDTNDMKSIRQFTGLCPQYDVLVDNMTCKEHLLLYASLKGVEKGSINKEVAKILKEVDLVDEADCFTKTLSGGQKRKLSVGIAFIGNPKIIFLDEPSAGMDPKSRRHLWALLKNKKAGRIILLTTHFMDEADILADRKAIVSGGKLKCCGSSLYLKTKFGIGYNLNLVVHPKNYKAQEVQYIVSECVPGAQLSHSHGMEICFSLPLGQSRKFADLFRKLEENCYDKVQRATLLGIMSYGISMTTLEEVFLRLAEIAESEEAELNDLKALGESSHMLHNQAPSVSGGRERFHMPRLSHVLDDFPSAPPTTSWHKFVALVKIRITISLRDKMATFSRIILPAILILISSVLLKSGKIQYNPPVSSILLTPDEVFNSFRGKFAFVDNHPHDETSTPSGDTSSSEIQTIIAHSTGLAFHQMDSSNALDTQYGTVWHFGIQLSKTTDGNEALTLLYNDTWIHALPMLVNLITNAIISQNDANWNITTYSQPWGSIAPSYEFQASVFTFSTMLGFAIIFLPSSFAQSAVSDRALKAKSQLRIAGLSPRLYWMTICTVDMAQYMIVGLTIIIAFVIFQLRPLIQTGAMLCTILFIILYIPIYTLALYIISYGFDVPESSQGLLQTSSILLNILFFVPVGMTSLSDNDYQRNVADITHVIFTFLNPFYTASGFFNYLLKFDISKSYTQQSDEPIIRIASYFHWENKLLPVFIAPLFWLPFLAMMLRVVDALKAGHSLKSLIFSYSDGASVKPNACEILEEDEDVAEERKRVDINVRSPISPEDPVLVVQNLHKEFRRPKMKAESQTKVAVKNLTFQLMPGEVLGLLGPNGAGKSTTLNMLTAEITPDAGMVKTGTTNIHSNLEDAYKAMGYCPQFDAVWPTITIREHLETYSVIRGYHPNHTKPIVKYFLDLLHLQPHADKQTKMLSGGTRRKLSFAMAMLGNPKVVLLDEPSTGMDPQSKRVFWDAINHTFVDSGRGAILTTHYMEEADALCHRIGIMINGQLECLGTTQHLKTRFGNGYMLEVKLASLNEANQPAEMEKLNRIIFDHFPSTHILEQFGPRVSYKISALEVTSLAQTFEILEQAKKEVDIGEYNFSQATLEQVFLEFAKFQTDQSNSTKEQTELSQNMAKTRQVTALHSRVTSATQMALPDESDMRQIEADINAAVAKYVDQQIKAGHAGIFGASPPRSSPALHSSPSTDANQMRRTQDSIAETDLDSQIYGYAGNRQPKQQASSTYGVFIAPPENTAIKSVLRQSSTASAHLKTGGHRTSVKASPKKEGDRSAVKFDHRHMVGSNISSTINDSVAYVIRRPKMHQSDLIEAEEPKETTPWMWIDDVSATNKASDSKDERPKPSEPHDPAAS